jgi:hypothetical protein
MQAFGIDGEKGANVLFEETLQIAPEAKTHDYTLDCQFAVAQFNKGTLCAGKNGFNTL